MLLQTPLKFWQMCKNSPAKISGTPQFFIRHVNNAWGRWNRLWTLTSRLTGRQGRCEEDIQSFQAEDYFQGDIQSFQAEDYFQEVIHPFQAEDFFQDIQEDHDVDD